MPRSGVGEDGALPLAERGRSASEDGRSLLHFGGDWGAPCTHSRKDSDRAKRRDKTAET